MGLLAYPKKAINFSDQKDTCFIFTGRNEVVAKVIFLHLSVILFTGGRLPQCMLGYHPLGADPPRADPPPEQ